MAPIENELVADQPTELAQDRATERLHAIDATTAAIKRLDLLSSLVASCSNGIELSQMDGLALELIDISEAVKKLVSLL